MEEELKALITGREVDNSFLWLRSWINSLHSILKGTLSHQSCQFRDHMSITHCLR